MKNKIKMNSLIIVIFSIFLKESSQHGMMLEPPNRSSLWRFNKSAPINYNDNQNFCGGFHVQWELNKGKCGVCGDNYKENHPQSNENGGKYGRGVVVREYLQGSIIDVGILLTANHKGTFSYSLCILKNETAPEPGEECFLPLKLENESLYYPVSKTERTISNRIKLPETLSCSRCVFRWHYQTGNNWGVCKNGTQALGCGPQETFRSCADIRINKKPLT